MPILNSPAKRMRSDAKKRLINLGTTSELKTLFKKLTSLSQQKSKDIAKEGHELISLFDKAVSRGIIPKGRADRKKRRIAQLIAKAS